MVANRKAAPLDQCICRTYALLETERLLKASLLKETILNTLIMSCYQCAKKLSFSAQKVACPMCKFIMCKKCLAHTLPGGGVNTKVCLQCYERATSNEPANDPCENDPPINYLRRIKALKNKRLEPLNHLPPRKADLSDIAKLTQRLDSLTAEERKNLPTEAELRSRLDVLNDFLLTRNFGSKSASSTKTNQDEVKNIVDQIQDEARLSTLHGQLSGQNAETSTTKRIYCSLCDNLANILCPACMDQEFCKYCFQRAHKSRHMRHHEGIPVSKPNKS
uniref:Zinc finger FYVE domain containing protein 19 n=1 Tax=Echinococcus granulosus TaxID=6210 RepID=A0A068WDA7_ECHGR|nr:zinc finger FYVE domain containing protein 19 [Echinococcus granulosus]